MLSLCQITNTTPFHSGRGMSRKQFLERENTMKVLIFVASPFGEVLNTLRNLSLWPAHEVTVDGTYESALRDLKSERFDLMMVDVLPSFSQWPDGVALITAAFGRVRNVVVSMDSNHPASHVVVDLVEALKAVRPSNRYFFLDLPRRFDSPKPYGDTWEEVL